jgi:TRAP-type C4-dicarboxylate transport system substrate-binding protein
MSTFSRAAPFIDAPFLFRDLQHWNQVLDRDLFKPVADEVERRARVSLIGYAGGGVRNIFSNRPATNMAELRGLRVRVQGAPIWSRAFQAIGMAPQVIAYNEIYNAIQNNVLEAGENEAAGVEQMRFFEVGPNLIMTQHAITIRPLCFSVATMQRLPRELQEAIRRAGAEAGAFGRQTESTEDEQKLVALEGANRLRRIPFTERAAMNAAVAPVMAAYAREIDAEGIQTRINSITA